MLDRGVQFPDGIGEKLVPSTAVSTAELNLYNASAANASWRVIDLYSQDGLPFGARVSWGYAGAALAGVRIDVPGARRITVFGSAVKIDVRNLVAAPNNVRSLCAACDGPLPTLNTFSQRLVAPAGVVQPIPGFASHVSILTADPAVTADVVARSATGLTLGTWRGSDLPRRPLGAAYDLLVTSATDVHLVFELQW